MSKQKKTQRNKKDDGRQCCGGVKVINKDNRGYTFFSFMFLASLIPIYLTNSYMMNSLL